MEEKRFLDIDLWKILFLVQKRILLKQSKGGEARGGIDYEKVISSDYEGQCWRSQMKLLFSFP